MATPHRARPRLMLLFTTTGYEAREFVQAGSSSACDTVLGSDRCHVMTPGRTEPYRCASRGPRKPRSIS